MSAAGLSVILFFFTSPSSSSSLHKSPLPPTSWSPTGPNPEPPTTTNPLPPPVAAFSRSPPLASRRRRSGTRSRSPPLPLPPVHAPRRPDLPLAPHLVWLAVGLELAQPAAGLELAGLAARGSRRASTSTSGRRATPLMWVECIRQFWLSTRSNPVRLPNQTHPYCPATFIPLYLIYLDCFN